MGTLQKPAKNYSLEEIENLMDMKGIIHMEKAIALLHKLYKEKKKAHSQKRLSFSR